MAIGRTSGDLVRFPAATLRPVSAAADGHCRTDGAARGAIGVALPVAIAQWRADAEQHCIPVTRRLAAARRLGRAAARRPLAGQAMR